MAEIPVERKSRVPWWLWLIALLLLGLLLWWLFDKPGPRYVTGEPESVDAAATAPSESAAPVETAAVTGPPITDVLLIVDAPDRPVLAGREVRLTNAPVLDVVGDRTFFVGPDANRRLFVVLNETPVPGDSAIDINAGQTVNLQGVLRRPGDGVIGGQPIEGMPADTDLFLHAQTAEIVARP